MKKVLLHRWIVIMAVVCVLLAMPAAASAAETAAPGTGSQGNVEPGPAGEDEKDGDGEDDTLTLDIPVWKDAAAKDYKTVKLSWNKVEGAEGYEVYVDEKMIGKTDRTSYTYTKAIPSVAASYQIRAYAKNAAGETVYSQMSASKKVTAKLKTPTVKSVTVTGSRSITFSWGKVTGATGYQMFVNGKSVGTTTRTSYTYTSSKLTWGKTHNVKVRAYRTVSKNKYYGSQSEAKSVKMYPAAPKMKKAVGTGYNSVKVTWKQVSGVSGYYVYRRTDGGKLKKIATVKGAKTVSYIDKTAKLGKKYKYTVRSYWKNGKNVQTGAANKTEKSAKAVLPAPKLKAPAYSKSAIIVKWSKVSGAQGYYVYRKTSAKGAYKKIATVSGGSKASYTDKKVKEGRKYIYTVRAYRKSGGKTYKSALNEKGVKGLLKIRSKTITVKDKKSVMYGKKVRLYYHSDGTQIQDVESIIGKQSSYQLYVNKSKNQIIVYAKDGSVYIPVKSFICSTGAWAGATPSGTFSTQEKLRWHELMGPCWGQWCTRIHGGVLFHSVFYNAYHNNNVLSVSAYNRLGTAASHGCVRVTAGDAKWIYDNCHLGTTVKIYSKSGYEPLKKPTAYKLSYSHTWDPTDPNMKYKCKQRGCH